MINHESGEASGAGDRHGQAISFVLSAGHEPIPGYVLGRRLGRGGYGEVWMATGPGGVTVALKFIPLSDELGEVELRALDLMKNIHHPHLTSLSGIWRREDVLVISMELGERTLMDCLVEAQGQGRAGIEADLLVEYIREVAKGIDHLNSIQIVHRDIKPKNLLMMSGGVKVTDFGLAKVLERTLASSSGAMTPAYAAPELFDGQASNQTDQYALAITYCQLRTGKLPFEGSGVQLMACHLHGTPDLTMLPEAERPVVARALAKKPAERWPDCRSFAAALAMAATGKVVTHGRGWKIGRRELLIGGLGVAALGGTAVAWRTLADRGPETFIQMREREIEREVDFLKHGSASPIRTHVPGYTEVDKLDSDDNSAFEILSDDRVVDMRGWREVPQDQMNEFYTSVSTTRRVRARKIKPADTIQFQGRTSGFDLFSRSLSPYPFRELGQRGETFVGNDRMKVRKLVIDVSSISVEAEFDIRTMTTAWNTLQTEPEQWFGVIGYDKSFKISLLLLFPPGKSFKDYTLMVARTSKETPAPYVGSKILLSGRGRDWIYWEVPNPKSGHVYRLHFKW